MTFLWRCPLCGRSGRGEQQRCESDGLALSRLGRVEMLGQQVGEYTIIDGVGMGGMAEVYLAEDAEKARWALKILSLRSANETVLVERFVREAEAIASIQHENLVRLTDAGTTAEDVPYFVMEYVEGRTLNKAIAEDERFSPDRTRDVSRQIAAGLAAVHDKGIVHRDLKPGNIMLSTRADGGDQVKILDFGIARVNEVLDESMAKLTKTGVFLGTPGYSAPEQMSSGEITPAADLYSLGALMYCMLAGRRPFPGRGIEAMRAQLSGKVPEPLGDRGGLEKVVAKLLAPQPADRPASARATLAMLESARPPITDVGLLEAEPTLHDDIPPAALLGEAETVSEQETQLGHSEPRVIAGQRPDASVPPLGLGHLPTNPDPTETPFEDASSIDWFKVAIIGVGALVGIGLGVLLII